MLEDFFIPSATTILLLPIIFDTDLYQEHVVAYMISIWLAMGTGVFLWYKNIRKVTVRCQDGEKQGDNKSLLRLSFKNMLSKAMPMMFVTTLGMVMIWTDTLMLGVLKNEHEVGIYNVAFRLSQILPLPLIAAPMIAAYYGKKEMENLASVAQKASNMILMVATPIFIFFLLFPKMLLGLFGPQFLGGTNAFLMLIIGQFVNALTGPVGVILTMTGKQVQLRNIIFLAICMNIILNFILIPEFGINGAAFASMTSAFILHLTPFLLVKKYYGFYTIGLSARRTRRKNE